MSGAGLVEQQLTSLRGLWDNKRQLTFQALNLAMIVFSALMIWKGLCVVTYSDSPVVVVLSGSMETALQRGDILFLDNTTHSIDVGSIIVFSLEQRQVPIVHRVLSVHEAHDGSMSLLTKGDNNNANDRGLYGYGKQWLKRSDVLGVSWGYLPYAGMVTIMLNDYPWLKYVVVGGMGFFVLTNKEQ